MNRGVEAEPRPIRVLYVVPGVLGGSSMIFAHNEITTLAREGVETRTFMLGSGTSVRRIWSRARDLWHLVREYQPDIVHAQYGSLTALICALVSRVPVIITYRGSDLNPSPSDGVLRSATQKIFSQVAALRAREIICVSRQLKAKLWWGSTKAVVIPSGVDLELFRSLSRAEARKLLGWPDNERIVVFNAGHTPAVKRPDLAEAAVAVMRDLIGEVRFVVLRGDTPYDEIPFYLCGADCLLLTSDYEGSPNIIKEALACGLPIVSVDVGDVVDRLQGVYPSTIVARDPRAIGAAAADIVVSGQRSNGREVIHGLSHRVIAEQILAVYHRVVGHDHHGCDVRS